MSGPKICALEKFPKISYSFQMRVSKSIIGAAALALCALLASCTSEASKDAELARISFAVDSSLAKELVPDLPLRMDISLEGSQQKREAVDVSDGAVITFDEIPVGAAVKAVATAYYQEEGSETKKEYFKGESDWLTVRSGSNSLSLPLKRIYYITYDLSGGTWKSLPPPDGRYQKGSPIALPTSNAVTRDGWLFAGWRAKADDGSLVKFTFTEETKGDFTLYANWVESGVMGISITVESDDSDIELSYRAVIDDTEGPIVIFNVTLPEGETETNVIWYVDGQLVSMPPLSTSWTFLKEGKTKGVYDIKVFVAAGSGATAKEWSAFAQVKVE